MTNVIAFAQSPTPTAIKSTAELMHDIQSTEGDAAGPNAIIAAVHQHNFDVFLAGIVSSRTSVRKLCLLNLDSFSTDQQKVALVAYLQSEVPWRRDHSGSGGSAQFNVVRLLVDRLQHLGIAVQPYELWRQEIREAVVRRLRSLGS